jgi:hypothetical protein
MYLPLGFKRLNLHCLEFIVLIYIVWSFHLSKKLHSADFLFLRLVPKIFRFFTSYKCY